MSTNPSQHSSITVPSGQQYSVPLEYFSSVTDPALATILIMPALGLQARFYQPLAEALAASGINAVLFEQRGHGESTVRPGRDSDFGFAEWLQEDMPAAVSWIQAHFPNTPLYLLGHSLGGHLAACYAGQHPDDISGLIFSACGTPWAEAYPGKLRRQVKLLCALIPALNTTVGYFPGHKLGFGDREAKQLMLDWRMLARHNRYQAKGVEADLEAGISRYPGHVLALRYSHDHMAPEAAVSSIIERFSQATSAHTQVLTEQQLGTKADHFRWAREPQAPVNAIHHWLSNT